ncbi:MAG: phosphoenolpyruvate--protein phosphotransferase [Planctomycetes bacterium]|nr:phosphoenolpyruvate--protein phosphotransferase [Planctomycetota bacterium]MCB9891566.1 phosphoenolpyruvate--protein phosphotransferase [Planctomycetota bacterium]
MLRGTPASPGIAIGHVHILDRSKDGSKPTRVSSEASHEELNRFRTALDRSREQIRSLKEKLRGEVSEEDLRILDVQLTYLQDPIFITDVENRVLNDKLALEAAIDRVIWDYSRILKLVENEYLRERAQDLGDVGLRVLRNLAPEEEQAPEPRAIPSPRILVVRELTVTDMFHDAEGDRVVAILCEEGGLTSHATILARSMKIPTVTGIVDLLENVADGEEVLVDGTEGVVRRNPDAAIKAEYAGLGRGGDSEAGTADQEPIDVGPAATRDGQAIRLLGTCGNLNDVEQAARHGLVGTGLYRTELLFLVERDVPDEDELVAHYRAAMETMTSGPTTFRLLDLSSDLRPDLLHRGEREPNPALGVRSIRALFRKPQILRRQLRAILRAGTEERGVEILVPFVTDVMDVRRVKEILFDEREVLARDQGDHARAVRLGVMIESPLAFLNARALARECDFLAIGMDNFVQYMLAADRKNAAFRSYYTHMHPTLLRALSEIVQAADASDRDVYVTGEFASRTDLLPLFLGAGLRAFSIAPMAAPGFRAALREIHTREARDQAVEAMRSEGFLQELTDRLLMHGYGETP